VILGGAKSKIEQRGDRFALPKRIECKSPSLSDWKGAGSGLAFA
jgi:hypothetical protein